MNTPYVKQFDENGVVLNPISGVYAPTSDNRKERRAHMQKNRFYGESKNFHLTIVKTLKYKRFKQIVSFLNKKTNQQEGRIIEHYLN